MKLLIPALVAGLFSAQAIAGDMASPNCKEPAIPIPQASDITVHFFKRHVDEYRKCLEKYIADQDTISKSTTDIATANAAHEAGEKAIMQFNEFMEKVNAQTAVDNDDKDK
jgi:hypothetical protein